MKIKAGDVVKLETLPVWVKDLPAESQVAFHHCLGGSYRVSEIDSNGLLVLDVHRDLDPLLGTCWNDLRVEPEYVRKIE